MATQVHKIRVPVQPEVRASTLRALARTWNGVQLVNKLLSKRNMLRTRFENRDRADGNQTKDQQRAQRAHTGAKS